MSQIQSISESTAEWAKQRQTALVFTPETGSTNDDAKKKAFQENADVVLYLTGHQTAGRGRGQNRVCGRGNAARRLVVVRFSFDQ